ncbi:MAG TPA: hypothetical protein VG897_04525 [Terriglobales bacterium]|nr:hypothetical protein [Terriglobales bacterium]
MAASNPKPAPRHLPKLHLDEAYFNGELVTLHSPAVEKGERVLVVGPWNLGPKVSSKPDDKRPNLYFVAPGTQHQVEGHPEYGHNEVLSLAPDEPKDFDVYFAVVLDPSLQEDFTSERQLLVAAQQRFTPSEDFTFDQIPSAGFLKTMSKISSLDGLEKFRHKDGSLPKLAIITAHFAVRFSVEKPEEKPAEQKQAAETSQHR